MSSTISKARAKFTVYMLNKYMIDRGEKVLEMLQYMVKVEINGYLLQ